jgi:hypothetical protein
MPDVRNSSEVDVRMRGTSKYVRSRSQPKDVSSTLIRRFDSGWWMNFGFNSASDAAKSSTGMSCCAVCGSLEPNASVMRSRACSTNARDSGDARYTKT